MDKEVYEVRLANWKQLILQCQNRPDGMTQKDWMEQHEIPESQFYYWLRKIRKEALSEMAVADNKKETLSEPAVADSKESSLVVAEGSTPASSVTFAEIDLTKVQEYQESEQPNSAAAVIRIGKLSIELSNTADERLISGILKAASYAC